VTASVNCDLGENRMESETTRAGKSRLEGPVGGGGKTKVWSCEERVSACCVGRKSRRAGQKEVSWGEGTFR